MQRVSVSNQISDSVDQEEKKDEKNSIFVSAEDIDDDDDEEDDLPVENSSAQDNDRLNNNNIGAIAFSTVSKNCSLSTQHNLVLLPKRPRQSNPPVVKQGSFKEQTSAKPKLSAQLSIKRSDILSFVKKIDRVDTNQ